MIGRPVAFPGTAAVCEPCLGSGLFHCGHGGLKPGYGAESSSTFNCNACGGSGAEAEFQAYFAKVAAEQRATGLANVERCDRTRWCRCETTEGAESYYEAADGYHGFFHDVPACGGVTQTG